LLEGAPVVPPAERPGSALISVAPGYFEALGWPVLAGRTFTAADGPSAPPVAIVNACFARRLFAGRDPVGRGVRWNDQAPWTTVVGVVGDVRHVGLERDPEPELFLPFAQRPTSGLALAARTFIDPAALAAAVRGEIKALDRELPVFDLATMEERLARQTAPRRFELLLIGSFAATALVLAALGVYGVVAYTVSQGAREIGLRIALGAEPAQIRRAVVRRGLLLAACGVVPGLAGGYALTRFIASALYGVSPRDGATFGTATAVILGVSTLASWLPARRAARIDPVQALRTE
jgi:predicted permease